VTADADNFLIKPVINYTGLNVPEMPTIQSDNIRIGSIKISEDETSIILRLVEYKGRAAEGLLQLPVYINSVFLTDMMENEIEQLDIINDVVNLKMLPFKILTLKLKIEKPPSQDGKE